jgi:hypothetical protein
MAGRTATKVSSVPASVTNTLSDATEGVHLECKYATPIDLSTDASTTVSSVPALLVGVYVNTVLSAHVVEIKDNATTIITLPASLAAGTFLNFAVGIRFETSLVVDPNDSSTGNITILYKTL